MPWALTSRADGPVLKGHTRPTFSSPVTGKMEYDVGLHYRRSRIRGQLDALQIFPRVFPFPRGAGIATIWGTEERWFDYRHGQEIMFSVASSFLANEYVGLLTAWEQNIRDVMLTIHFSLASSSGLRGAIPPPPMSIWCLKRWDTSCRPEAR
jgi:hypothetical protein